jgi:hypothetical protein
MTYHYRSVLRPITQLPLNKLGWVYDPRFVGPDVRDLLVERELTPFEVKQFDLELISDKA